MKKFLSLLFLAVFCAISTFSISGCSKNEVEKQAKNLTSYAISAEFNDELKQISATETIVFYNNSEDLTDLLL